MKQLLYILLILAILAGTWFVGNRLRPAAESAVQAMTWMPCDPVANSCEAKFADQALRLRFIEQPTALKPFAISLQTEASIDGASIEFNMRDMVMGFNRSVFQPVQDTWQASAILPVCVSGRRDWTATLLIEYQGTWWRGEFDFVTE